MVFFKYSRWDGTQEPFRPGADQVMDRLSDALFEHGDVMRALRDLFREGMEGRTGDRMQGLRDMQRRLNRERRERLERHDLDSVIDEIREELEQVLELERGGIQQSLREAEDRLEYAIPSEREQLEGLMDFVRARADRASQTLDNLPDSPAGSIRELSEYDFIDPEAREKFDQLLARLRQQMMQNFARRTSEAAQDISPEQQGEMREMLRALNRMLRARAEGREPEEEEFAEFMERFGQFFDPDRPGSLDELLDMMERQMQQLQSLLGSMSAEARAELMQSFRQALDDETLQEMANLAGLMEELRPGSTRAPSYPFSGGDETSLDEAMGVMEQLQEFDELESALRAAGREGDLDGIDPEEVARLLGEDAAQALEDMKEITRLLEEQGYVQRNGDRWELTPRAIRKMGERALREVFGNLGRDRLGGHETHTGGHGGEATGATLPYRPGEPFDVNLYRSLSNAVKRSGPGVPVRMTVDDFEIDEVEHSTDAATVLMIDQSSSMHHYGRWGAAKRVAMALQSLIQSKYPRDRLFIVGFSDYAVELKPSDLPTAAPNDWVQGTNMQHAMMIARRLLSREQAATRQIIMITDGEPTAHLESGYSFFNYPPTQRTVTETLKEVRRCTQAGVTINTFMLEQGSYLTTFIDYVSRINRGRAFFTDPERLGDYLLVDYVNNRRRRVA